jgi:hypothetical protein
MTRKPASRETLERLAEALAANIRGPGPWDAVSKALHAYEAETTPPLRTRAEVDAEIVKHARVVYIPEVLRHDGYGVLADLLQEPTAPEGEKCPACHLCGRTMTPLASIGGGASMGWGCFCCVETNPR